MAHPDVDPALDPLPDPVYLPLNEEPDRGTIVFDDTITILFTTAIGLTSHDVSFKMFRREAREPDVLVSYNFGEMSIAVDTGITNFELREIYGRAKSRGYAMIENGELPTGAS